MGRWGRQSPILDQSTDAPPLPPRKSINVVRQSSFSKLGSILSSTKNGIIKNRPQSK